MSDQADKLRQLIGPVEPAQHEVPMRPPLILVTGGRLCVGATTVAVNLAAALADRGERILLLDAAEAGGNLATDAALENCHVRHTLADALAGSCAVADAIRSGPCGLMVLGDAMRESRRRSPLGDFSRRGQERLLAALTSLQDDLNVVVADAGNGLTPWTRRLWLRAELVLLVTTPDAQAVVDAYALLKRSIADGAGPDVRLVVNQCDNERRASDVQQRFSAATQQFLGRRVPALPSLPRHIGEESHCIPIPRVWEAPQSPFGQATIWLAHAISDALAGTARPNAASAARCNHPS